jgi:antirestriction protein ArdC
MATTTKPRTRRAHAPAADAPAKPDVRAEITARVIAALEAGVVPWTKPWASGIGRPRNMETGNAYTGVNPMLLGMTTMERGYTSPWWGTFPQIIALGGNVKAGQNQKAGLGGTTIIKVGTGFDKDKLDADGQPSPYKYVKAYRVFNAEQCENLPDRFYPAQVTAALTAEQLAAEAVSAAEAVAAAYLARPGAPVFLTEGVRACYRPSADTIRMPAAGRFATAEHYCSTRFHELGHSTGHTTRLNREGIGSRAAEFGCEKYGLEELVAEMTAAMLAAETGISAAVFSSSASYIGSWIATIKGDPTMVNAAASAASAACDLILGVTRDR